MPANGGFCKEPSMGYHPSNGWPLRWLSSSAGDSRPPFPSAGAGARIGLQLLPQVSHVNTQIVVLLGVRRSPYFPQQLAVRPDPSRIGHQHAKEPVFNRCQMNFHNTTAYDTGMAVHLHLAKTEQGVGLFTFRFRGWRPEAGAGWRAPGPAVRPRQKVWSGSRRHRHQARRVCRLRRRVLTLFPWLGCFPAAGQPLEVDNQSNKR